MTALGSIGIGSLVTTAGYQLIQTQDISTAVGSVNFTGLDGANDHSYKIEAQITSEGASATDVELTLNGSDIIGYRQYIWADHTSRTGSRIPSPMPIGVLNAGSVNDYEIHLGFADHDKVQSHNMTVDEIRDIGTTIEWWQNVYYMNPVTMTNIADIEIKTNIVNSIGSPSRFRLYKLTK